MECPYCRENDPENLIPMHYPGLKGSSHIECQTCGQEFSSRRGETHRDIHLHIAEVFREKSEREYGAWKSE